MVLTEVSLTCRLDDLVVDFGSASLHTMRCVCSDIRIEGLRYQRRQTPSESDHSSDHGEFHSRSDESHCSKRARIVLHYIRLFLLHDAWSTQE